MATDKTIRVNLTGKGNDARNEGQSAVVREFMRIDVQPAFRLMVNYTTGFGKGKAAIDCAIAYHDNVSRKRMFIGCYTETQRDNVWKLELAKWGSLHPVAANPMIECYASMRNIKGNHFGVIILDEAQHLTEDSYKFFENNTFEAVIVLTATVPRAKYKQKIIQRLTYGRRLLIETDAAIDAEVINDFEVHIMQLQLNMTERFKMFKTNNTLYNDYTGYLKMCLLLEGARKSGNYQRIKHASIDRMRFIGDTKSKRIAALFIMDQFRQRKQRFLVFANSIEQCELLSPFVYHSKTSKDAYNLFKKQKINELISINGLKESENFDNLGRGLIVQSSSNHNDFDQMKGRLQRLKPGEISKILILCAKNTMDEKYIREALTNTNPTKVKWYDLDRNPAYLEFIKDKFLPS